MKTAYLNKIKFFTVISILLISMSMTFTSCDALRRFLGITDTISILDNTNKILDKAVNDLAGNSENFNSIIQEAIDDIKDAHIKEQLNDALFIATNNVSAELKCTIQFTADFLIKKIRIIKAEYNDEPIPLQEPMICVIHPDGVDMNLPPNLRNNITISGYFLKENYRNFELYHYASNGIKTNKTSHLSMSTDYKLKINLGSNGITLNENSSKLVLELEDDIVSEIVVLQVQPEPCETKTWSYTNLSNLVVYPVHKRFPGKRKGDNDFDDNGPCVTGDVSVFTKNNGRELWAYSWVQMWECPDNLSKSRSDYTYGNASKEMKLATVEEGFRIQRINIATTSSFQYIDKDHSTESISGSGPVSQYRIHGDTEGSDLGASRVEISFKSISVSLIELGDCISN
ncbi:hypothetical protein [Ascidiimonas sp. W6]|uniref:hypothetical protein n=1 Tax=Ascidiimonas meishanensis TaxID=3128903 RepID=UPI0030EB91F7